MTTPRRTVWAAALGLILLGGAAFLVVWRLESQAMDEALAQQVHGLERHWNALIQRFASETEDIGSFGARLVTAAESNPAILNVVVVSPEHRVVNTFSRDGTGGNMPCFDPRVGQPAMDQEHAAGTVAPGKVGCLRIPIVVAGENQGAVYMHTLRSGVAAGQRAGRMVRRTAVRLAPVFLAFYILLGGLIVVANRSARRWRLRAASAERVEVLGALAEGINHDIRNPLNAVSLSLQFLGRKHEDDETRDVVDAARRQTQAIGDTLDEFARFMRVHKLDLQEVSMAARVSRAVSETDREIPVRGDARVAVDLKKMDDALSAIVGLLARQARPEADVEIRIGVDGSRWNLTARCDAAELDAARFERLFDPYVRARPRDVGRGLGMARAVFQAHGGDLTASLKTETLTVRGSAPSAPRVVTEKPK